MVVKINWLIKYISNGRFFEYFCIAENEKLALQKFNQNVICRNEFHSIKKI